MPLDNRIIKEKELNYWDFSKTFSSGIHKISAYPATMVPDMQNELIRLIKREDKNEFCIFM